MSRLPSPRRRRRTTRKRSRRRAGNRQTREKRMPPRRLRSSLPRGSTPPPFPRSRPPWPASCREPSSLCRRWARTPSRRPQGTLPCRYLRRTPAPQGPSPAQPAPRSGTPCSSTTPTTPTSSATAAWEGQPSTAAYPASRRPRSWTCPRGGRVERRRGARPGCPNTRGCRALLPG